MAGQAIVQLILGHRIIYEVAFVEVAGFTEGLTGTAGAVTAVKRNIDLGLVGRICNGLVFSTRNELGDSVFEGECNLVLGLGRHNHVLL
jgi:hypothetical protein